MCMNKNPITSYIDNNNRKYKRIYIHLSIKKKKKITRSQKYCLK